MAPPVLKGIHVENYGCIREATVEVPTPLHAFIGPNDSGKSTILRAVRTAVQFAGQGFYPPDVSSTRRWAPFDPAIDLERGTCLEMSLGGYRYEFLVLPGSTDAEERIFAGESRIIQAHRPVWGSTSALIGSRDPHVAMFRELLKAGARMVRLSAKRLREPSRLIPEGSEAHALEEDGYGIASLYDLLVNRGDDTLARIAEDVCERFPSVRRLQLRNVPDNRKQLQVELTDGTRVPAEHLSDGLLYYLAFAGIAEMVEGGILLVEEPEVGLHPARIVDVVRALRRAAERCTVLIATHSPMVLGELEPEEISVVSRPDVETGTKVRRLVDVPHIKEWMKVYTPGELWVTLADGRTDAELFEFRGDVQAGP